MSVGFTTGPVIGDPSRPLAPPSGAFDPANWEGISEQVARGAQRQQAVTGGDLLGAFGSTVFGAGTGGDTGRAPEPRVAANALTQEFGIPGALTFDEALPRSVAAEMYDAKRAELARQDAAARRPGGLLSGIADFGVGATTMALDPLAAASTMVPYVGPSRWAIAAEQAGSPLARAAARAGVGAITGASGMVPLAGAKAILSAQDQADYSATDALLDIAYGSALGAGLHPIAGAAGDAFARFFPKATPAGEIPPEPEADLATREAALRVALAQQLDGRPVEVRPVYQAADYVAEQNRGAVAQARLASMTREEQALRAEAEAVGSPPDEATQARLQAIEEELTQPGALPATRRAQLESEPDLTALDAQAEQAAAEFRQPAEPTPSPVQGEPQSGATGGAPAAGEPPAGEAAAGTPPPAAAEPPGETGPVQNFDMTRRGKSLNRTPQTLLQLLASRGGVRDLTGELPAMDLHKPQNNFQPGFGPVVRKNGRLTPDQARELAVEHGYIRETGDENRPDDTTPSDLHDAIDREMKSGFKFGKPTEDERYARNLDHEQQLLEDALHEHAAALEEDRPLRLDPDRLAVLDQHLSDLQDRAAALAAKELPEDIGRDGHADEFDIPWDEVFSAGEPAGDARGEAQPADTGAAGPDGGAGRAAGGAPAVDEHGQSVIPGAERISDRALAERRMAEPLKGGNAPPDFGLFDTMSRTQRDLFEAEAARDPAVQAATEAQARAEQVARACEAAGGCMGIS